MSGFGRILIVDDDASVRQTLTRIFHSADCDVTSAGSGSEALRLLRESSYDLVFLDLRMPEYDGLQILKEIRDGYPKLPVILLTAFGSLQSALEAIRLGATDYLLKPVDPDVLVARTRIVLKEQAIEKRKREITEQIEALQTELRSLDNQQMQDSTLRFSPTPEDRFIKRGSLIIDLQAIRAIKGDKILILPPASFDYLVTLARRAPETVDYQTLVNDSQGYTTSPIEARELAKWHIHVLRQALETEQETSILIQNVRGVGYRLIVD